VQDRVTGLLTAPDPVSVAAALVEILGDATAADRMGAQGAARVRSTASWKAVAEKAVPAYREAILAAGISRSMP
jgi:glycosyltransferase involved in cell wall biosynthesis